MTATRHSGIQGVRKKGKTRAQTTHSRGLVTTRKDGSTYHQDRMRWPASLGTYLRRDWTPPAPDDTPPEETPDGVDR